MKVKKGVFKVVLGASLILLIIPFVFAGFFGDLWNSITGMATTATTTLSITIGNTVPNVTLVSTIGDRSINTGGQVFLTFLFNATDLDGNQTINDTSAQGMFNKSGEDLRLNSSCTKTGSNANTTTFNCTIGIWYWDAAGNWTINATIFDNSRAQATNYSRTFELQPTTAMVMSPTALTWPSIALSDKNQTSNNDPIIVNNTANKDIADGSLTVQAIELQGDDDPTKALRATNFTVSINTGGSPPLDCAGTKMVNNTATGVTGASMNAGNNSAAAGNRSLYFCLSEVPAGATSQTYSTTDLGAWTIAVS